jgi:hypothetical protein
VFGSIFPTGIMSRLCSGTMCQREYILQRFIAYLLEIIKLSKEKRKNSSIHCQEKNDLTGDFFCMQFSNRTLLAKH